VLETVVGSRFMPLAKPVQQPKRAIRLISCTSECSNGCTVLKKCSCRFNRKLCSPKCHCWRKRCDTREVRATAIIAVDDGKCTTERSLDLNGYLTYDWINMMRNCYYQTSGCQTVIFRQSKKYSRSSIYLLTVFLDLSLKFHEWDFNHPTTE
jgi:hypothetical protein